MTTAVPGTTPRVWPPPATHADPVAQDSVPDDLVTSIGDVKIADFSYSPPPVTFTMDGDRYDCYPVITARIAQEITGLLRDGLFADVDANDPDTIVRSMSNIGAVFKIVMKPASATRFIERLNSRDEPLDLTHQVIPVLEWLLGRYGVRPTQPSTLSSDGSHDETGGTRSTDGASPEALTQHG